MRLEVKQLRTELLKFGGVGAIAYLVSVGGFNLLVHTSSAPLAEKPVLASLIAGFLSVIVAYLGNRYWTWRDRPKNDVKKEVLIFFVVNLMGIAISALCLAISRYGFGLNSPLSDNISANIVGVGFGTLFRFFGYRNWVFKSSSPS